MVIFKRLRIPAACVVALLLNVPETVQAAAWTQEKGRGLIITSLTYDVATKVFNNTGRLESSPKFVKHEANIYAEYGVTDWLTVLLLPGFQRVSTGFSGARRTESGINNTGFGGRIRLFNNGRHVVSVEGTYFLPGGIDTTETTVLSRGNGDQEVKALYGLSWDFKVFSRKFPSFWDIQLGYRQRDGAPANEFRADFTMGVRPFPRWQIFVQSFNIISDGAGKQTAQTVFPVFTMNKAQLTGVYDITERLSIQFGGFRTLAGRNIIQETAAFGAIWLRF